MIGLFLVMIFLIYTTFIANPDKPKPKINTIPNIQVTPTIDQDDVPAATNSASLDNSSSSSLLKSPVQSQ